MRYSTLFFDLDGTLYPESSGLWAAIRERMEAFMHIELGLSLEEIPTLRHRYYQNYGTTLRGLQQDFQIDSDYFLAFVHDLPLRQFLEPNPELRSLLESLSQPKWIFTNADDQHAHRVVDVLNLHGCFEGVIDVRALNYHCKPEEFAYRKALTLAGSQYPNRCLLFDDSVRNLDGARQFGFQTVHVGPQQNVSLHRSVSDLLDLPDAIPDLWETRED
jgi:putative hydrolase of the HAD superfamily